MFTFAFVVIPYNPRRTECKQPQTAITTHNSEIKAIKAQKKQILTFSLSFICARTQILRDFAALLLRCSNTELDQTVMRDQRP